MQFFYSFILCAFLFSFNPLAFYSFVSLFMSELWGSKINVILIFYMF